ncbi:uncharacterized protein BX664DRAFT_338128 [Halteromyces radiatus]|uniref:uncharacterized protein n=1 Tax=Halteromyces radiatus TaxID=101107 RepID=UPI00221FA8BA|nr:uncharacterized protein BX664DRAFT_338128 [Halteromyces radiatus]KAI8084929.1 hypothetical protein BX664DRAFT_338128 [Halteromyces radiatus]
MDIGQRPSRQRRHLPIHGTFSTSQSFSGSVNQGCNDSETDDNDDQQDVNTENHTTSLMNPNRRRRIGHGSRTRMKPSITGISTRNNNINSGIWRVWFWRMCIVWIAFLCLRVATSVFQGDTAFLSVTQYVSQISFLFPDASGGIFDWVTRCLARQQDELGPP